MPRKRKTGGPTRQAPPIREIITAAGERLRSLAQQARDLHGRVEGIRHSPDDLRKLREALGPWGDPEKSGQTVASLRRLRREHGSSAPPAKLTKWRVKIPHADEVIDQMLAERKADPVKFHRLKAQVECVREILKKRYGQTVPDSQIKTLERRIAERRDKPDR